jgi:ATP adenylyltransferase
VSDALEPRGDEPAAASGDTSVSGDDADPTGTEDHFERLWTPHRMAYIRGEGKPADDDAGEGCPFCRAPLADGDESLVVARRGLAYAVLNRYPYNAGHLLLCPYRHVADFTDLTAGERTELDELLAGAMRTLREVANPHGFNIGLNQGQVAGAGIAAHLHTHVVPRWGGDSNFMPIVAHTRVLPQLLTQTRDLLVAAWPDP